jgi:signal transduction histidine kinase
MGLLRAAQSISGEVQLDLLLGRLMEVCLAAAGAQRGVFLLEEPGGPTVRAVGTVGAPAALLREALAVTDQVPRTVIEQVRRRGHLVVIADASQQDGLREDPYVQTHRLRSVLALPISRQGKRVAVLYLENDLATRLFTPDRIQILELLSSQIAISLENSLLFEDRTREAAERSRAEAALRLLSEASAVLGESLDHQATVARVARMALPLLGDFCTVDLLDDAGVERVTSAHRDPTAEEQLTRARARPGLSPPRTTVEVLETAAPLLLADLSGPVLARYAPDAELRRVIEALGARAALVVPLRVRGRALGAMTFVTADPARRYDLHDLSLAEDLAGRVATAVDNVRLYCEAREAVRQRDDFLSVAAHELNTPMTSLALILGALATEPEGHALPAATRLKLTRLAEAQGRRVIGLCQELLDSTRFERGSFVLHPEPLELTTLLAEVIARVQPALDRAGCRVTLDLPGPIPGTWDPVRLDQVVLNLLTNAARFGAGAPVDIRAGQSGGAAWFSVRDQGVGVEPEAARRIFERFGQAGTPQRQGGLGLGLYVCRRIVESHGGVISVQSSPGQGATFLVTLPCAGPPARAAAPAERAGASQS